MSRSRIIFLAKTDHPNSHVHLGNILFHVLRGQLYPLYQFSLPSLSSFPTSFHIYMQHCYEVPERRAAMNTKWAALSTWVLSRDYFPAAQFPRNSSTWNKKKTFIVSSWRRAGNSVNISITFRAHFDGSCWTLYCLRAHTGGASISNAGLKELSDS